MEFYERVSGARMHTSIYKPIKFVKFITRHLIYDILDFSQNCYITINEIHNTLSNNKVWKIRLVGVGCYNYDIAMLYGLTGVLSRCVGIKKDLRINMYTTYGNYSTINFNSYISNTGDSYSRYLLRIFEIIESINIISQSVIKYYNIFKYNLIVSSYKHISNMESIINHFKY